jgi:hypothetical protein
MRQGWPARLDAGQQSAKADFVLLLPRIHHSPGDERRLAIQTTDRVDTCPLAIR